MLRFHGRNSRMANAQLRASPAALHVDSKIDGTLDICIVKQYTRLGTLTEHNLAMSQELSRRVAVSKYADVVHRRIYKARCLAHRVVVTISDATSSATLAQGAHVWPHMSVHLVDKWSSQCMRRVRVALNMLNNDVQSNYTAIEPGCHTVHRGSICTM